jgi:trk system potassium uptake protein TrkH
MKQSPPSKSNVVKIQATVRNRKKRRPIPVAARLVLGLLLLIGIGSGLLLLPGVTTRPITFSEALFTTTSSATVTGLTVLTTSTDFTFLGQIILLCLIQLGGVGYMVLVAITLQLLGRRISLLDRLAISTSLGLDKPATILRLLRQVVVGLLLIESLGALLLYIHWRTSGIVAPEQAAFYAIFHAVSAFCNAGFDLFVGLPQYPEGIPGDNLTLLILGLLIFLGGLGIPVFVDFSQFRWRRRLTSHTRLTLNVVIVLTLIGWLGLFVGEIQSGGVLERSPLSERLVHTWFQSVSTRTAGFPGLRDFDQLLPESRLLVMVLMFIGCAPASLGGGITTGTFGVLVMALWSSVRGHSVVRFRQRTVPTETIRRAAAVLSISLGLVFIATWLILVTHEMGFSEALFEVISALATCGLSLGATGELNLFGRFIIILMMFWGRLGALTIAVALFQPRPEKELVHYPEATLLVG